jgi:vitamin B12 transporter
LSIDGSVNGALLPSAGLDRIEVVKGAQGGLYGSNAVAGVVHLLTARPTAEHVNRVRAEAGSFTTTRLTGSATGPVAESLGYALGVDLMSSRGFSVTTTPQDPVGCPDHHEDDALRRGGVNGRVEWSPSTAVSWYASGLAQAVNQDYDDWGDPEDDGSLMRQRLWRGATGGTLKPSQSLMLALDAAYTGSGKTLDGAYSGVNTFDLREQYASARATWTPAPLVDLTIGGDGTWDQGVTDALDASDHTVGVWGQAALHHAWADATATLRRDENTEAGGATTWRLGAAGFTPERLVKVHANAGTGFVTPSLDQRYGLYPAIPAWWFAETVGNPELGPERSLSRDVGITLRPFRRLALEADITVYRTDYEDKIVFVYGDFVGGIPNTYTNLTAGRTDGVEASLSLDDPTIPVKARVSATWQRFEDDRNALQRLLPGRKGRIEVGYAWPAVWLGTHVDMVGKRWTINGASQDMPGYAVLGATVRWSVTEAVALYVRGENLTDTHYEINPGYTTMPRAGFLGVDATF